jgi:hypothetical protein
LVSWLISIDVVPAAPADPPTETPAQTKLDQFVRLPDARRTVGDLLGALAGSVSMPLVISPDVSQKSLKEMTHLGLTRSTGAQAMAWVSAMTGLGLDVVDDMLVVSAERSDRSSLERVGALGVHSEVQDPRDVQRAEADVLQRISNVDLVDASLTQALVQIRDRYHIDLVPDQAMLANQELVSLQGRDTPLRIILDDLSEQCGAKPVWMESGFLLRSKASIATTIRAPSPLPLPLPSENSADRGPALRLQVHEIELNALLTGILKLGAMNAETRSVRHAERGRKVTLEGAGSAAWLLDALVATPPQPVRRQEDALPVNSEDDTENLKK